MEMKDSVSLQKRGAVMEEKHGNPKPPSRRLKNTMCRSTKTSTNTATRNLRLRCCFILIAIILVIVILKATGVPFAVKDWLSHVTGDMIALR